MTNLIRRLGTTLGISAVPVTALAHGPAGTNLSLGHFFTSPDHIMALLIVSISAAMVLIHCLSNKHHKR